MDDAGGRGTELGIQRVSGMAGDIKPQFMEAMSKTSLPSTSIRKLTGFHPIVDN